MVPPSGGTTLEDKFKVISQSLKYINTIRKNIPSEDVIHVRCPGSLPLYGMLVTSLVRNRYKWIKYAGNWTAHKNQMAPSHFFQREWLRLGLSNAAVTVNTCLSTFSLLFVINSDFSLEQPLTGNSSCEWRRYDVSTKKQFTAYYIKE